MDGVNHLQREQCVNNAGSLILIIAQSVYERAWNAKETPINIFCIPTRQVLPSIVRAPRPQTWPRGPTCSQPIAVRDTSTCPQARQSSRALRSHHTRDWAICTTWLFEYLFSFARNRNSSRPFPAKYGDQLSLDVISRRFTTFTQHYFCTAVIFIS